MCMKTTIYIVRHGETAWNRDKIFRGHFDVPLNKNGKEQAKLTAEYFKDKTISEVYTSPLSRAFETAKILLDETNGNLNYSDALLDINYGDWTGLSEEEVAGRWPEIYRTWCINPCTVNIPHGDSLEEVFQRSFTFLEEIVRKHYNQSVVLLTHRVVNKLLIIGMLGLHIAKFPFISQGNCCINEFEWMKKGYIVNSINNISHLVTGDVNFLQIDF